MTVLACAQYHLHRGEFVIIIIEEIALTDSKETLTDYRCETWCGISHHSSTLLLLNQFPLTILSSQNPTPEQLLIRCRAFHGQTNSKTTTIPNIGKTNFPDTLEDSSPSAKATTPNPSDTGSEQIPKGLQSLPDAF